MAILWPTPSKRSRFGRRNATLRSWGRSKVPWRNKRNETSHGRMGSTYVVPGKNRESELIRSFRIHTSAALHPNSNGRSNGIRDLQLPKIPGILMLPSARVWDEGGGNISIGAYPPRLHNIPARSSSVAPAQWTMRMRKTQSAFGECVNDG